MVTVSAPGKLMLMGEHGVVYGYPCIVTAIDKYLTVNAEKSNSGNDIFITPGNQDTSFVENTLNTFRIKYRIKDKVIISTKSDIGNYGLGSSAAVTVATAKALIQLFNINIGNKELFNLCFETVLDVQKKASGFDVAASVFGGTLYYQKEGLIIDPLPINDLSLVVGFSGEKADTVSMINLVAEKRRLYQEGVDRIFQNIADFVNQAKTAILEKDLLRLGTLMNYNQDYLEDLGVSTEKLNQMILAARRAGALGAKLSGAGGGDCMIALVPPKKTKAVEEAIKSAGGEIINIKTNSQGTHISI